MVQKKATQYAPLFYFPIIGFWFPQFTFNVNCTVWLRLPEVAVTVTVYVPAGVPVVMIGDGVVVVPPPPPPPQPGASIKTPSTADIAKALAGVLSGFKRERLRKAARVRVINSNPPGGMRPGGIPRKPAVGAGCDAEWTVVEMLNPTVVPPAGTLTGFA